MVFIATPVELTGFVHYTFPVSFVRWSFYWTVFANKSNERCNVYRRKIDFCSGRVNSELLKRKRKRERETDLRQYMQKENKGERNGIVVALCFRDKRM